VIWTAARLEVISNISGDDFLLFLSNKAFVFIEHLMTIRQYPLTYF